MTKPFTHFVGIDWSGAKGKRHAGLSVALCDAGKGRIKIVLPPDGKKRWSREGIADWIASGCGLPEEARILVGIDSAYSIPFLDEKAYIPGGTKAGDAKSLWQEVDDICTGAEDLFGGPFVEKYAEHYLRTNNRGTKFKRRLRLGTQLAVTSGAGPCESVFHLIGPSQVGLSGLSTMRMLHHLDALDYIAIWPYDPVEDASVVLVEIYAAAFASMGGHRGKIRDEDTLQKTLKGLGFTYRKGSVPDFSDHDSDALITAAGLRHIASDHNYWQPAQLSTMVRRTEGWVFGIK
ncbi:MAG: hypothetical protein KUG56_07250 [Kordiimonadaceae bacterium]|nr:hypothetical protein [Kordiimonadaceae bacterium]